jgi:hypothetical protein
LVGPGLRLFFSVRLSLARLEARSDTSTGIPITEGISSGPPRHRKIGSHPYQRPKQIDRPNREDQTRPQLRRGCVCADASRTHRMFTPCHHGPACQRVRGRIAFATTTCHNFHRQWHLFFRGRARSGAMSPSIAHAFMSRALLKRALATSCHHPHLNGHACTQHTDNHNTPPQCHGQEEERPRAMIVAGG